ncbi:hypothetical protein [Breznakia pachnodae]|uniref:HIRAN domain-containing protein n=1 Tax=Breznakia pachnodae TaxID=265178 RepID=A0ABU0E5J0_9FIRM|nr:hypothetical protein [Breznakia pachnodae]MDQ0362163.1 hypothetical protein [Breznakia pachnodae]
MEQTYLTIVGVQMSLGISIFRVNGEFHLEKDIDNNYDDEAICVKNKDGIIVGYIANSINTVSKGTKSAGRVYDTIEDNQKVRVRFIVDKRVIVEVVND